MNKSDFYEFLDLNNDLLTEIELTIHRVLHFNDIFTDETLLHFENYAQWINNYKENMEVY